MIQSYVVLFVLIALAFGEENEIDFENKTVAEVLAAYNISLEQLFEVEEDLSPEVFDPSTIFDPPPNKTVNKENEHIKDLVDLVSPNIVTVMNSLLNRTKRFVNPEFDPCQSFYYFACGNYMRNFDQRRDSFHPMWLVNLKTKLVSVLKNLLEDVKEEELQGKTVGSVNPTFELKAKRFYASCMDDDRLNERGAEPLLRIIDFLGGWPVLKPDWRPELFDWLDVTYRMYKEYDVIIWHSIYFQQTNKVVNKSFSVGGYNTTQMDLYREYVEHMLVQFGVAAENATAAATEIVDFEMEAEKLKVYLKRSFQLENETLQTTVAELYRNISGIEWLPYLEIILGERPRLSDEVVLFPVSYFRHLSNLMTTADPRILANYMFWTFAQKYTSYLSSRFYYPRNSLLDTLEPKLRTLETPRWKQCLLMMPQPLREGFVTVYMRKYYDEVFDQDVLPVAADVKDSFKSIFVEKPWIDESTKFLAGIKLSHVKVKADYNDLFPATQVNEKFKNLNLSHEEFFENVLNIERFMNDLSKKKETPNGPIKLSWSVSYFMEDVAPRSSPSFEIFLPVAVLRSPFYHYYFPEFVKYASVGSLVGTILADSFRKGDNPYPDYSIKLGNVWWSNSSLTEYNDRVDCFHRQYHDIELCGRNISDNAFVSDIISSIGGLRASYRAYKKWLHDNKDNLHTFRPETFIDVNMTTSQLFFLSYAQTMCGGSRMWIDLENRDYCNMELRMFEIFSKTPEFAEAYECPLGSPMNPFETCSVW